MSQRSHEGHVLVALVDAGVRKLSVHPPAVHALIVQL